MIRRRVDRVRWIRQPVPPPPPNVPPLEAVKCEDNCADKAKTAVGMRQKILAHRVNPACSACHNLMDPIGFAMENFDWTGRWRDKEFDGSEIDVSGSLPSGGAYASTRTFAVPGR